MSIEYCADIYKKSDDSKIATVYCNRIKSVMDYRFADCFNDRDRKLTVEDLYNAINGAWSELSERYRQIREKTLMISLAANVEVKRSLEEDLVYLNEEIDDLKCAVQNASCVLGEIECVVENLEMPDGELAYKRNGFSEDVYFKLVAG